MNQTPLHAPWIQTIAQVFTDSPIYAVGGVVRNTLMGLPISDVDLCGAARPDAVLKRCEGTPVHARLRAAHFGTVELHVNGYMAEYTTFRQDSYRTGHQPVKVHFADTMDVDALRRDFSVNALYSPLQNPDRVFDPTGGLDDLRKRRLHTVTADPDQVLKDDGLRILRALRFQAELGFTLTDAVFASCAKYVRLLDEIAAERKRDELTKLLLSDVKYPMLVRETPPVSTGLAMLVGTGAWQKLFRKLKPFDFKAFDYAARLNVSEKFALLYHKEKPIEAVEQMLALRYAKADAKAAGNIISALQALQKNHTDPADILCFGLPAVQSARDVVKTLADADAAYYDAYLRAEQWLAMIADQLLPPSLKELAINGNDLLEPCHKNGVPVARIGVVLNALWRDTVNRRIPNTREALLTQADRYWIDSTPHE